MAEYKCSTYNETGSIYTSSVPINIKHLVFGTEFYAMLFCKLINRGKVKKNRDGVVFVLGNVSPLIDNLKRKKKVSFLIGYFMGHLLFYLLFGG